MRLIDAQCPVCHGKCSSEVPGVGIVICFTCRGRGRFLVPGEIDPRLALLPRRIDETITNKH